VSYSTEQKEINIGGLPVLALKASLLDKNKPQFLEVNILPGFAMNVYKIKAWIPSLGEVDLIHSLDLEDAKTWLENSSEEFPGNRSFSHGGAFLIPFANRIRGKPNPDDKTISVKACEREFKIPANWKSKDCAIHGLFLNDAVGEFQLRSDENSSSLTAKYDAQDFKEGWPSKTILNFEMSLSENDFKLKVMAKNTGLETLPIGMGWHPYFLIPSGKREELKLSIPSKKRLEINNYESVFPTGNIIDLKNTKFDFSNPEGSPLGDTFLDECYLIDRNVGIDQPIGSIIDPSAGFGIKINSHSPEIKAVQVYSPKEQNFIAIEPQFNISDPFGEIWMNKNDCGMRFLKPQECATYEIDLNIFELR
jgi:aldose 1-epimerase